MRANISEITWISSSRNFSSIINPFYQNKFWEIFYKPEPVKQLSDSHYSIGRQRKLFADLIYDCASQKIARFTARQSLDGDCMADLVLRFMRHLGNRGLTKDI